MMKIRKKAMELSDRAEKVCVVESMDNEKVLLKGLIGKLRWKILSTSSSDKSSGEKGLDVLRLFPEIAIACMFDPESGEAAFSRKDKPMLEDLRLDIQQEVIDKVMDLSGLSDKAAEDAKDD